MTTATDVDRQLAELDADLRQAWRHLQMTRRKWAHSPNAQAIEDEEEAERYLNQLLDQRFALQPRKPSPRS